MAPKTAIIIRCRNEERWIGEVLTRLQKQTDQDFEIVVVDSGSTDRTLDIVRSFPVTLLEIPATEFTYPHAINVGISASQATDYYVILSAHSLPATDTWLADGLSYFTKAPNVLGVYGPLVAMPDGTIWDHIFHAAGTGWFKLKTWPKNYACIDRLGLGTLGFTNAIIRKDLYKQYPINEAFAAGGEDGDWHQHWIKQGYQAIKTTAFAVHHSHYLGLIGWYQQWQEWRSLQQPKAFKHLSYRTDAAHTPLENIKD